MFYNIKIKSNKGEYALESFDKAIIQREMDLYFASMYDASEEFKSKIKDIKIQKDNTKSVSEIEELKNIRENFIEKPPIEEKINKFEISEIQIKPVENKQQESLSSSEIQLSSLADNNIQEKINQKLSEPAEEITIDSSSIETPLNKTENRFNEINIQPAPISIKEEIIQKESASAIGTHEINEIKIDEIQKQELNISNKPEPIQPEIPYEINKGAEIKIQEEVKTETPEKNILEEIAFETPTPTVAYENLQNYVKQEINTPEINISNFDNQIQSIKEPEAESIKLQEETGELQFIGDTPNQDVFKPTPVVVEIQHEETENKVQKDSVEGIVENIQNKLNSIDITTDVDGGNLLGAFSDQDVPTIEIAQEEAYSDIKEKVQAPIEHDVIQVQEMEGVQPINQAIEVEKPAEKPVEKPQNNNNQVLDFRLFLSGFVAHELSDKFLICAYYVKNILKQDSFSIKFINSKLFVATGEIADMSIVDELVIKEYLKQVKTDEFTQYTITPEGERYFSTTFQV